MSLPHFIALHIPDGFISVPVALTGWLLAAGFLGMALRQTQDENDKRLPLLGVLAAFIFAAQMINFPVAGGTSGHLLGGALAAILLGPWAAVIVMSVVIGVQALLFQDGGLLALGFNIFNMGVLTAFVGYATYTRLRGLPLTKTARGNEIAAGIGAWLAVMAAAAATSLQLALSGTSPLPVALPAMLGVHALIGIGEALVTVSALAFIRQTRPDLLQLRTPQSTRAAGIIAAGLIIALGVAFFSPLASPHPDGLERVAADEGFLERAEDAPYELLPDYTLPGVDDENLTTIAAGVIGVLVVTGITAGARWLVTKKQGTPDPPAPA